jgi:hypothetical protein
MNLNGLEIRRRPGGLLQLGVARGRPLRPGARLWHPTLALGELISPEGDVLWRGEWEENTLHDGGELSIVNVWAREQANPSKYQALLGQGSVTALGETLTFTGVTEAETPGTDGYSRQQVLAADWATPVLDAGDYATTAAQKTFGPNTNTDWSVSHVALTGAATGTSGGLFITVPLSAVQAVASGVSFRSTMTFKVQ